MSSLVSTTINDYSCNKTGHGSRSVGVEGLCLKYGFLGGGSGSRRFLLGKLYGDTLESIDRCRVSVYTLTQRGVHPCPHPLASMQHDRDLLTTAGNSCWDSQQNAAARYHRHDRRKRGKEHVPRRPSGREKKGEHFPQPGWVCGEAAWASRWASCSSRTDPRWRGRRMGLWIDSGTTACRSMSRSCSGRGSLRIGDDCSQQKPFPVPPEETQRAPRCQGKATLKI